MIVKTVVIPEDDLALAKEITMSDLYVDIEYQNEPGGISLSKEQMVTLVDMWLQRFKKGNK